MTDATRSRIEALAVQRGDWIGRLLDAPRGLAWCEEHTALADEVVHLLVADLRGEFPDLPPLAVLATGGYGRRELSPHSDLDLTVVPLEDSGATLDAAVRRLFQDLHWAFGTAMRLPIGYAFRLIGDAAGLDAKTRTGLLDLRFVAGDREPADRLESALEESFAAGEFLLEKIREREEAFARFGSTPLLVEPHLKEGAGGLRCGHCANWLRRAIGEQPRRSTHDFDAVVAMRNLLHAIAGRGQDQLTRPRQAEIADRIGRDVYEMTGELAGHMIAVHEAYRESVERIHEARFALAPGVVALRGEARIQGLADPGEAAVGIAVAARLGLRIPEVEPAVAHGVHGAAAVFALSRGEAVLRQIDRAGLLERLLPELTACRTLMPRDNVHTYSVFEHTLMVVREIDGADADPFLRDVRDSISDLEALYLAALLHDIGKIAPERPHSEVGAELAAKVAERWQLGAATRDRVVWLVLEHLSMARTIRFRDVYSPATVQEFAALVGDRERLDLLTVLTWADVRAVAPTAWTPSQETFLRELYSRTAAVLEGEAHVEADPGMYRKRLMRQLQSEAVTEEQVQRFVESLPVHYLTGTPFEVARLHLRMAEQAAQGAVTVEFFHRPELAATDVTVCAPDRQGRLADVMAVLYAYDLSLLGIRASTTRTEPAVILDTFTVAFGGRPVPASTARQVRDAMLAVLRGEEGSEAVLRRKGKDPDRKLEIFSYTFAEGSPALVEIRAPRGRGMPYRIARRIARHGWNVQSARVGQWAGNGAAAFYVTRGDGGPLVAADAEALFQDAILA